MRLKKAVFYIKRCFYSPKIKSLPPIKPFFSFASTGLDNAAISNERSPCLGYCFAFVIQIDSTGHYTASNLKDQSTVEGLLSKE
jgi:hypothetical protein